MNLDGNDIINIFQSIEAVERDQIDERHFKEAYENLLEQLYHTCLQAVSEQAAQQEVWVSIRFSSIQLLLVQASLNNYRKRLHQELCTIQSNGQACDHLSNDVLSVHTTIKKVGQFLAQKQTLKTTEPEALAAE